MFLKLGFMAPFLINILLTSSAMSQEITESLIPKSRLGSCGDTCAHISISNSTEAAREFSLRIAGGNWSKRSLAPDETKDFSVSLPVHEIAKVRFQARLTEDRNDTLILVPGTSYVIVTGPQSLLLQPETP